MTADRIIALVLIGLTGVFTYVAWFKYPSYVNFEVGLSKLNPFSGDLRSKYQSPWVKYVIRFVATFFFIGALGAGISTLLK